MAQDIRRRAGQLEWELWALYLACRDPRVPWYAKALAAAVAGYAFSPIDLIPDFIPVLGYLDDLLLVPLGVALAIRLVPAPVLSECRAKAREHLSRRKPRSWVAAAGIIAVWLVLLAVFAALVWPCLPTSCPADLPV